MKSAAKEIFLNFHGVGGPPYGTDEAELSYWWEEHAFLSALDGISQEMGSNPCAVLMTFDDGNVSDVEIALPSLLDRGMTAWFFVCAGRVGKRGYLDGPGIRRLSSAGMKVGSHGKNHVDWRKLGDAELHVEIVDAKRKLEDICGCTIDEASVPFGSYDRRVLAKLRSSGYRRAYTSDGGTVAPDAWLKPRNTLDRSWQWKIVLEVVPARQSYLGRLRRTMTRKFKALR